MRIDMTVGQHLLSHLDFQTSTLMLFSAPTPLNPTQKYVYQVSMTENGHVITLRSPIKIINCTNVPLQLRVTAPDGQIWGENSTLNEGEDISVPLEFINQGILSFRPSVDYNWSDSVQCDVITASRIDLELIDTRGGKRYLRCDILEEGAAGLYAIKISHPIILENVLPFTLQFELSTTGLTLEVNSP